MKVIVFSGHMIDQPNRPVARFPSYRESAIRVEMAMNLDAWRVGAGDVGICGAACGGDILFAELCLEREVDVQLLVALPVDQFIEASVRHSGPLWVNRFHRLLDLCEVRYRHEHLDEPCGISVFEQNNIWCLDKTKEFADATKLLALLVWDEKPTGDGPGGTSDFARRVAKLGGDLRIVNPLQIAASLSRAD